MKRVILEKRAHVLSLGLLLTLTLVLTAAFREAAILYARAEAAPTAPLGPPNIAIEKSPETQEISQGGTANFTITVTNTGLVDLENISISDALAPNCNHTVVSLTIGSSNSHACSRSNVTQSFLNQATVTASSIITGTQVSDSDTAFVKVNNPNIKIVKSPDSQTKVKGGTAIFGIIVLNTSDSVDLKNVQVIDPLTPNCNRNIGLLGHNQDYSYSCQKTNVTSHFVNVATVVGANVNNNDPVSDSDAAEVEVLDPAVAYSVNPTSMPEPGGKGTYTVRVTNNSSIDVTLTGMNSNRYGNLFSGSNNNVQNNDCAGSARNLAANGGQFTCTFEVTFNSQPGVINDTVTATVTANSVTAEADDDAAVTISDVLPSITVSLSANPTLILTPGGDIDFTVRVDNNSTAEAFTLSSLNDTLLGNLNGKGTCSLATIAADNKYQCTFTAPVTGSPGSRTNTVTATGSDNDGNADSDSDSVTIIITALPITYNYLPNALHNYVVSEPNNSCAQAYRIDINRDFFFLPDDKNDWYWFDLNSTRNVEVQLTNFLPIAGQVVAYSSSDGTCATRILLGNRGDFSTTKILPLGSQPAGRYFVLVINDGPTNIKVNYKLRIRTVP